jgi:hypothetical protein
MPIDFAPERWEQVRQTYRAWWAGELDRPIIPIELVGRDPGRPQPEAPLLSQATCADFSYSPEQLIDRIDYELARKVYLGDAFPWVNMDVFGPGVAAAFMGARLDNASGRVWFWPPHEDDADHGHPPGVRPRQSVAQACSKISVRRRWNAGRVRC